MKRKFTICNPMLIIMIFTGCNSEGAFDSTKIQSDSDIQDQPDTDTTPPFVKPLELVDIAVTQSYLEIYVPTQYEAIGHYSDGSIRDITSQVNWITITPNVASFDTEGMATPISIGETQALAQLDGLISDEVTLNVIPSFICGHTTGNPLNDHTGGGINDTDLFKALGKCLKIREIVDPNDNVTKWLTSTPSETVLDFLSYTPDTTPNNTGNTYGGLKTETGSNGPAGQYGLFRQDGLFGSYNSQYDRWCDKLSWFKFAGKSNWKMVKATELIALHAYDNSQNLPMYPRFGWPSQFPYWTATPNGPEFFSVHLNNGVPHSDRIAETPLYASCVSAQ